MLENTSKNGIYRGFDKKEEKIVDGIIFSWGTNHHGNGNTNFSGTAIVPSVGKLFHLLNTSLGRFEVDYKIPDFCFDKHVKSLSNENNPQLHFSSKEGYNLFLQLAMLDQEAREEQQKEREEAGVPKIMKMKFAE